MPLSTLRSASTAVGAILLAASSAMAQSTAPFWSSYFGGSGRDEIVAIRRGPGNLITIVGHTTSGNLATPGVVQVNNAGGNDVFVARLDPAQPTVPLWCTYVGGSDLELAFDAEVDPVTGITTVVGLSESTDFPGPTGQPSPIPSGTSDGFVVQIDLTGATLISSMFLGIPGNDRLCEVEIDPNTLLVTVAGVTEQQLPAQWTVGTLNPTYRGGATDAFVARVDANGQLVQWATHLGGSSTEGWAFATWGGLGFDWEGNLNRMALTIDPAGNVVLATTSFFGAVLAQTTGPLIQPTHGGGSDVYLAVVGSSGTTLVYGSFLGGLLDDRPRGIANHPFGGFALCGLTFSGNLPAGNFPTTTNCYRNSYQGPTNYSDGFVCHVDPNHPGSPLRYSTFLGGNAGEDNALALAVETSGNVTVAGVTAGGTFPTTTRCHQDTFGASVQLGFLARLQLASQGAADLLYSTYIGGQTSTATALPLNSLVLDDVGDVFVAGATRSTLYPQQNPIPVALGSREGVFTHLPLLPGGVFRDGLAFTNPACAAAIYTGAGGAPVPGETFLITATNAPPNGLGVLVFGDPIPPTPLPWPGTLLVNPIVLAIALGDLRGAAQFPIAVSPTAPLVVNWGLAAQWFFFTNAACPGTGMLANSERLNF